MTRHHPMTLVLGGTGKTGSRLVSRLTARDLPVRIGSRAGGLPFDWERPATWGPALDGVHAVYVSYYPDLAVPGAVEAVGSFAELAVARGVRRLVLLSGRGEDEALACERALVVAAESGAAGSGTAESGAGAGAGADWTVLRCSWFSQNFSEGYLLGPVLAGEVALPAGPVGEPFLDADDIADVTATVLTEDGHAGRVYELTGPRLLTFAEATATIAEATGRPVRYARIGPEEFAAGLAAEQVPADVVAFLGYLFGTVLDGRNASVTDDVRRVLGRPARDFADFARATAASGAWIGE
ncbi:NAD(P)H-binding protein [Streptomyces sp. 71268]|uniref:NAD(P)H-binding protein n=1 Tax=Streptomyces sp. 71268 TaxID=3002640 RepID=UPI0023F7BDEA|nr:NAD(P)H-binding protein [Streptomyces sp. 71268]WEV26139.1 NAD(P)H-binding protein [Streptomyces sp. 71268]